MEVVHERVAGLDVHKRSVAACVRISAGSGRVEKTTRTFDTMTDSLRELSRWLVSQKVTHVVMESTGVYWKPIFNVLEGDFAIVLCNAKHVKQVPGRKTDVKDCEWLAQLFQFGLIRGSFIPARQQRELRDLTRTRTKLLQERGRVANRVQKLLEDANIKLSSVASDSLGKSGQAMIQAIVDGEENPEAIANLARRQLRGKIPQLRRALDGFVTPHHRFMLGLELERYRELSGHVDRIDSRILVLNAESPPDDQDDLPLFRSEPPETPVQPDDAPPPSGQTTAWAPLTWNQAVGLLITIPGVSTRGAENILAETGLDMSRFPTPGHLASWAGICPGNNESAGKRMSGRTTKGNKWLRSALVMAARGLRRTKSYLSSQYRRIAARRGRLRAQVAVGHSILTSIWVMLSRGVSYHELGEDYFDRRDATRLTKRLVSRLERLGHTVNLEPSAA